ncbi:hypothetical protein [Aliarcobacter skirrowii]|uniref:hypothetical protein n=1 Tax=Aliarcobacter skirrowii TaxID=28200 RepID=UPI0029B79F2B|nr:hypothetical protein [Aliarcobacter skirrowii]MDX4028337.1 hypothetical protein [Aliarcobacter skirrowii]
MEKIVIKSNAPKIPIVCDKHFWKRGIDRNFELSALVPLYAFVSKNEIPRNKNVELSIGSSTIIFSLTENDTIQLKTGWKGNRKKEII